MSETWDVTIQKNRPQGEPHATTDTVTYRVTGNPAQARQKAGKRASRKWGANWAIIEQERRG